VTPDQIRVGQVLQGKGSDSDKTRTVLEINDKRAEAVTLVHRIRPRGSPVELGTSTLYLRTLAQWASHVIETKETDHANA
jgi:hypothetical protein